MVDQARSATPDLIYGTRGGSSSPGPPLPPRAPTSTPPFTPTTPPSRPKTKFKILLNADDCQPNQCHTFPRPSQKPDLVNTKSEVLFISKSDLSRDPVTSGDVIKPEQREDEDPGIKADPVVVWMKELPTLAETECTNMLQSKVLKGY